VVIIGIVANRGCEIIAAMNAQTSSMNRQNPVNAAAKRGLIAALALFVIGQFSASAAPIETTSSSGDNKQARQINQKINTKNPPTRF